MEPNNENVVIEGLEVVIERDLNKHKAILDRTKQELISWEHAKGHEIEKKRRWRELIGGGKYDDEALRESTTQSNINIRHFSDKVEAAKEAIAFETNIVDTLAMQLEDQRRQLTKLAEARARDAIRN